MKLIIAGSHVHRLSVPVSDAGAGAPPHHAGHHRRRPGRGSAAIAGPGSIRSSISSSAPSGSLWQVGRYAPESPDGAGRRYAGGVPRQ